MTPITIESVAELFALLARGDGTRDSPRPEGGEAVDLLAHALQCADALRFSAPEDLELQVAGLVHDLGHLIAPGDDAGHGRIGAEAVRALLGDRVADLVEAHIPAKRYLVTTDPIHAGVLSPVSVHTLDAQGGPMSPAELERFESHPDHAAAVLLRRADDAAKDPERVVPPLASWESTASRVAERR